MKKARTILTHLCLILAVVVGVLLVVDTFNPTMGFLDNTKTKILLWVLCIAALVNGILYTAHQYRKRR